ncbi:MAG: class I SAM-dependent methyltransferase [Pseudomonadota bacterium]
MKEFGPATFGEMYADEYDTYHDPGTTVEAVYMIELLAGDARMLELAIGTGRMALPLKTRGLDVHGLEASPEMIAKLREKDGGEDIPVTLGDMADFELEDRFDFVFLVFNTLFNLTSQAKQLSCFESVGRCLNSGGKFLLETFVPDLSRFQNGQDVAVKRLDGEQVWIEAVVHDPVDQLLQYQRIRYTPDGVKLAPLPMRYAWPSEIDLMAKLAGLELVERWGGWQREPFNASSNMHVSVYEKRAP